MKIANAFVYVLASLWAAVLLGPVRGADAPAEIKLGTLHASSGSFASISMPVYSGLNVWVNQKNAEGGVFVKAFNKKIPIRLISYDDQSNTATAANMYTRLITQDKVTILAADSGTVLTSIAVPIAFERKMLLINHTGTGANFFSSKNPYVVLVADPVSSLWPKNLVDFLIEKGRTLGIKRVALLYCTNDFNGTQADVVRKRLKEEGSPLEIVFDEGIPTNTTIYSVIVNRIKSARPDAVIELGYANNDISFLRSLQENDIKFNFTFSLFAGLETELIEKTVGFKGIDHLYTLVPASNIEYKPEFGMSLKQFRDVWAKENGSSGIEFGFNAVAGYTSGLVIEKALMEANSLEQLELRRAIFEQSGKLKTLDGTFELDPTGAQIGEMMPLGQIVAKDQNPSFVLVYPPGLATGDAVYPAPVN
jgi:branched-chain amino acid transport system substrate-binding protein